MHWECCLLINFNRRAKLFALLAVTTALQTTSTDIRGKYLPTCACSASCTAASVGQESPHAQFVTFTPSPTPRCPPLLSSNATGHLCILLGYASEGQLVRTLNRRMRVGLWAFEEMFPKNLPLCNDWSPRIRPFFANIAFAVLCKTSPH